MDDIVLKTDEEKSAFYRGSIIQSAIEVELRMDIIIGRFLSSNNQEMTLDTINVFDNVESVGFHAKNLIIQYILKKHFIGFLKENKEILKDIEYLITIRNYVAHKRPDFDKYGYKKLTWAKTSKNSVITRSYDIGWASHKEYEIKASEVLLKLYYLETLVIERANGK